LEGGKKIVCVIGREPEVKDSISREKKICQTHVVTNCGRRTRLGSWESGNTNDKGLNQKGGKRKTKKNEKKIARLRFKDVVPRGRGNEAGEKREKKQTV